MKSRTSLKRIALFCLTAAVCLANVITGVSGDLSNPAPFTIVGISNQNQKGNEMGGFLVSATFGDGSTLTCTLATNVESCSNAGDFSFIISPGTQNTSAATWEIRNLRTGTDGTSDNMISFTMDGRNAGNGGGGLGTVFNPCVTTTAPLVFNVAGGCSGTGGGNGATIQDHSGGLTGVTASAFYDRAVMLSSSSVPAGDLWFRVTLTFAGTTFEGQGAGGGTAFLFDADTDQVDIPEPGTYGLVGLALAGLGAFRLRRKS